MNQQRGFSLAAVVWVVALVLLSLVLGFNILPYFFKAKIIGCPFDAPATLRSLNSAEATYDTSYREIGYAPNLAILGSSKDCPNATAAKACLIDSVLGCPEGVGQGWCSSSNYYRYNIQSSSRSAPYKDFWITATPIAAKIPTPEHHWTDWFLGKSDQPIELLNYCTNDEFVIRVGPGPPRNVPYTKSECERLSTLDDWNERKNKGK